MNPFQILTLALALVFNSAPSLHAQVQRPGKPPPKPGGGKGGPPGLVKPAMSDTLKLNVYADNWSRAKEFSEQQVSPKQPFYEHDFKGAKFIWSDDLALDNTVIFRTRIDKPGWVKRWNTKPDLDITGASKVEPLR